MGKDFLVGYTGFVGSNLLNSHAFSGTFNSKNIEEAYGKKPNLLVYAGVRAEMFLANRDPEGDYATIAAAMDNIRRIQAEKVVLISTVAVYSRPIGADEDTPAGEQPLSAYGRNRHLLETWVEEAFPKSLIVRLPALYGANLKKNFLYDYIHRIPGMLTESKFKEFASREPALARYYSDQKNGFYKCAALQPEDRCRLRACFQNLNFSALNFTDSRSCYQFYNLEHLWSHILLALEHDLSKLNLVTPPVRTAEIFELLENKKFENELGKEPYFYDLKTKHSRLFGRDDGYICSKEEELNEICRFVNAMCGKECMGQ